jgi:hypothetical protein
MELFSKCLKKNGSSGRIRTYNPSVNSCKGAHFYRLLRLHLECAESVFIRVSALGFSALHYLSLLPAVPGIFPGIATLSEERPQRSKADNFDQRNFFAGRNFCSVTFLV